MGAWFRKDKGRGYSNLWANGENPNVKGRTHQNCQLPISCLFPQSFISTRNWLRWLLHGNGKSMEKIRIGKSTHFLNFFLFLGKVKTQKRLIIPSCIHVFIFPHPFSHSRELSQEYRASYVYPFRFWVVYFNFPMDGRSFL